MFRQQHIDDDALYPGHVVRRMLAVQPGGNQLRWIEVPEAARILAEDSADEGRVKRKCESLRKQCARWARMDHPPVRVMKKGPTAGSHWLLCESDVCTLARRKNVTLQDAPRTSSPPPAQPAPVEPVTTMSPEDEEEATIAKWCEIATRNL